MYLQVVGSIMVVVFLLIIRKGEELKVPYYISTAATRDNHVPYS